MWLYAITADKRYGRACRLILEDVEEEKIDAVVSVQVISELSGVLYRIFKVKDITKYVDATLSYPMRVISVTSEIVRVAACYSRDWDILPYDGIHIATAISERVEAILTADKELRKVKAIKSLDPLLYGKEKESQG